ncbi:MAG: chemotaxis protein CheW, partial [Gammaproteobacteria bacterium]
MTALQDQQALLLYRVGPVLCCAPSLNVLSIIQPVPLTHPPGTDPARPGIFRHDGHVVRCEELRVRFGVAPADRRPGRLIIAETDGGRSAFWVDDIIDVMAMPQTGWGQLPAQLPRGIFSRTLMLADTIYLYAELTDLQKLQGHDLLKAYIEKLSERPAAANTPANAERPPTATARADIQTRATGTHTQAHTDAAGHDHTGSGASTAPTSDTGTKALANGDTPSTQRDDGATSGQSAPGATNSMPAADSRGPTSVTKNSIAPPPAVTDKRSPAPAPTPPPNPAPAPRTAPTTNDPITPARPGATQRAPAQGSGPTSDSTPQRTTALQFKPAGTAPSNEDRRPPIPVTAP